MPGDKTYTTAAGVWPRYPKLPIESVVSSRIARFPLNFLETSSDNTWGYVCYVVSLLVVHDALHPGATIDPRTGQAVDADSVPQAGVFRYIEEGSNAGA